MSARSLKWLGRQTIEDRTLAAILRALAAAADASGRLSLGQAEIATRAMMTERAVRSGLQLLEHFGMITRQSRGAKKAGRRPDLITLVADGEFVLSRDDIREARRSGSTKADYRNGGAGCTTDDSRKKLPNGEIAPSDEKASCLYKERARTSNGEAADAKPAARAKVWLESASGDWRASLTYQGLTLDLGRHECRDLAEAECRVHLLDIDHSLRTKSGTPREPVIDPEIQNLSGKELWRWLNEALPGERDDREADGHGVRGQSPGREFEGGSPHDPKDRYDTPRARGDAA